jgi:hypothetical protein
VGGARRLQPSSEPSDTPLDTPPLQFMTGMRNQPHLARPLREALGSIVNIVSADAVFISYFLPEATGKVFLLQPEDAINLAGNTLNSTDDIVDLVRGGAPTDPTNIDGLSQISGAAGGDLRRQLGELHLPPPGTSESSFAAKQHSRALELSLLSSVPPYLPSNASSETLRLGITMLSASADKAAADRDNFLYRTSTTSALYGVLGPSLGGIGDALQLTALDVYITPGSVKQVTLPYTRSWLYYLLDYLRKNIIMICTVCSIIAAWMVAIAIWRTYCPRSKFKWGAVKRKVPVGPLTSVSKRQVAPDTEVDARAGKARESKRYLDAIEAKLLNPEPTADELDFSEEERGSSRGRGQGGRGGYKARASRRNSYEERGSAFALDTSSVPGSVHDTMDDLITSHSSVSREPSMAEAADAFSGGSGGSGGSGDIRGISVQLQPSPTSAAAASFREGTGGALGSSLSSLRKKHGTFKPIATKPAHAIEVGDDLEGAAKRTELMAKQLLSRSTTQQPLKGGARAALMGAGSKALIGGGLAGLGSSLPSLGPASKGAVNGSEQ